MIDTENIDKEKIANSLNNYYSSNAAKINRKHAESKTKEIEEQFYKKYIFSKTSKLS